MKKRWIAMAAAIGMLFSTASFADTDLKLNAFDSQTVIDGNVFDNARLQYPFLQSQDKIYMPLDYHTLRTLGYLSGWNSTNNTFRIYAPINKTFNLRTSEVKWSSSDIIGVSSSAQLEWMGEETFQGRLIEANGILYMELSDQALDLLDWAAAYHPFLGLQMNISEGSAYRIDLNEADLAYYDGLARFMMTRNKSLAYEKASDYASYIKEASDEYDIDEIWIMAMIWQESWYDENTEYKGACGLMQIMESTGRALGLSREQLFDPELSIKYGTKYLRDQLNAFDNDLDLATLAYNQGPVRVKKGTYKTWYLEQVREKSQVIEAWLLEEGIDLKALTQGENIEGSEDETSTDNQ